MYNSKVEAHEQIDPSEVENIGDILKNMPEKYFKRNPSNFTCISFNTQLPERIKIYNKMVEKFLPNEIKTYKRGGKTRKRQQRQRQRTKNKKRRWSNKRRTRK
jgi:wyosine [tRNA(Phe)-imidazoG37] synthetase (radical SAM superfamily)